MTSHDTVRHSLLSWLQTPTAAASHSKLGRWWPRESVRKLGCPSDAKTHDGASGRPAAAVGTVGELIARSTRADAASNRPPQNHQPAIDDI